LKNLFLHSQNQIIVLFLFVNFCFVFCYLFVYFFFSFGLEINETALLKITEEVCDFLKGDAEVETYLEKATGIYLFIDFIVMVKKKKTKN
jgi:hypothetical protein